MQRSKIEWCDYVLNPTVGCNHGCSYCYAKALNKRFKFVPVWEEPQFFPERLSRTKPIKLPKNRNRIAQLISPNKPIVFVGSMTDLFGNRVEHEWILRTLDFTVKHPEAIFMFLTKHPEHYIEYVFKNNCILGTSVSSIEDYMRLMRLEEKHNRKFISIEPLLGMFNAIPHFQHNYIDSVEFVIVGAMTGPGAVIPQQEWIESIKHPVVYYKDNILKYIK